MTVKSLIPVETFDAAEIFKPNGGDAILEKVTSIVADFEADGSTEKGRKEISSFAYKIRRSKTLINEMKLTETKAQRDKLNAINAEAGRIISELEKIISDVMLPVTEFKEAERKRKEEHAREVERAEQIIDYLNKFSNATGLTTIQISERIEKLENHAFKPVIDEYATTIESLKGETLESLKAALDKEVKREENEAELKRLRDAEEARKQKEREKEQQAAEEKRIKEAAEKAARDEKERAAREAEDKERRHKEALENQRMKAEKEKADAIAEERERAAKEKAAIDKAEAEAKAARDKANAEDQARKEDEAHRAKIIKDVIEALNGVLLDNELAKNVVELMAEGKIPHVKVMF